MTDRPVIVIAATPTPNGDLHVGHLAGPYLAGDIYSRYLRASGREVIYTTCTDNSQTYVVSTAVRQGITPAELCERSTAAIQKSLDAMGISMSELPPIDEGYRAAVLRFATDLHATGRLRLRTVRLPYLKATDSYLYDGLLSGFCPTCLAGSSGGGCEDCGHPNFFDELLEPSSSTDPSAEVSFREHQILVLAMEDFRDRLTEYFQAQEGNWRPHAMQLIRELLGRPLPEIPITIPGSWGIAAPFSETPGQVLYPWIEAMPASMYGSWWAAGQPDEPVDELWRAERDAELVYFHGFDNTYHWGLMDLVLLMAHGERYIVPTSNICNEFYDLDGSKFSTSRNHLIRAGELLTEVPRDLVRFFLALTAPETQRTNFTRSALAEVATQRLVEPWNAIADAVSLLGMSRDATPLPITEAGRQRAAAMIERLRNCYELPGYSAARAAETIAGQLSRLRTALDSPIAPGDLLLQVRTLLAGAAPILIDLAARAADSGIELSLDQPAEIAPFELPRLAYPTSAGNPSGTQSDKLSPALDAAV